MDTMHPVIERSLKAWMPSPWPGLKRPLAKQPSANISYGGADWQVTYDYSPSERETPTEQGHPASVEICEVYLLNHPEHTDLKDLLGEHVISDMENKILESLGDY